MPSLAISPEAEQDLLEIWLYIAEDSPVNADRFLDRLEGKALNLARAAQIGADRPDLAPGLRSFPVDRYVLYYRASTNGIELVRVLHGSRDIEHVF